MIKSKFLSVSSMKTLLAILKGTDARCDVILAGGVYHRFPWRHFPPLSIVFVFGCLEENLNRKLLQNSFVLWHRLTLYIEFGLENCNIPVVINFLSQVIFVFLFFGAGGGGWEGGMVMYANKVETKQKIEITWVKKMTITLHRRLSTQYILHN